MEKIKVQLVKQDKGIMGGYIEQRIKKNKNFMCAITGPTGSGKTYSALRLAEICDKDFTADNIVFTPKQFIDLLNSGTLKKGSVIVADEFGVSMNSRNWQSVANQVINYVLQTFRSRNYVVFFTAPDFAFIDVAARKLFHAHFMTQGINHKEKYCLIKPYMLQINQRNGDIYYKFLTFTRPGDTEKKLGELTLSLPAKDIIKDYEKKKYEFVTQLNLEIEAKLRDSNEVKEEDKAKRQEETQSKWLAIDKLRAKGMKWNELADLFSYGTADSIRVWYSRNRTNNKDSSYIN